MEKIESILVTPVIEELVHDCNHLKMHQFQEMKIKEVGLGV